MRMPPSMAMMRGRIVGTSVISVAAASASPAVANWAMARRLATVGGIIVNSPAACCSQGVGRADPDVRDDLVVVVQRRLSWWLGGEEEPRVVAPRCALRGDPVAEVVHPVDRETQVLVRADLDQPALAVIDLAPVLGPAGHVLSDRRGATIDPSGRYASSTPASSKLSRIAATQ